MLILTLALLCPPAWAMDGELGATSIGSVNISVTIAPRFDFVTLLHAAYDSSTTSFTLKREQCSYADMIMIAVK
jgi:hypothetical protein